MKPETAWKWMPAFVLLATVVFAVWRIQVAVSDPHFGAVDQAYEKGARWDDHQARLQASEALGWQVGLTPGSVVAEGPSTSILSIRDADGKVLLGLSGQVSAFHNAYPGQVYQAELVQLDVGNYAFDLPLSRAGLWRWQVELELDGKQWFGEFKEPISGGTGR